VEGEALNAPQNTHWYRVLQISGRKVLLNWDEDAADTWRINVEIPEAHDDLLAALTTLHETGEQLFIWENQSDMDLNGSQLAELIKAIETKRAGQEPPRG
jgi:hypothetical protein